MELVTALSGWVLTSVSAGLLGRMWYWRNRNSKLTSAQWKFLGKSHAVMSFLYLGQALVSENMFWIATSVLVAINAIMMLSIYLPQVQKEEAAELDRKAREYGLDTLP